MLHQVPPDAPAHAPADPLGGYTVGITADRRWEEQAELLRRRGAAIHHGPAIRTLPLGPGPDLRRATDALIAQPPAFLIANTGIGLRSWFAAADSWGLGDALHQALARARIFARGPKAAAEVHRAGLEVEARALSEQLDDLVALLAAEDLAGQRVAFQRHGDASPDALAPIVAAGAAVVEVPVYRWILPEDSKPVLRLAEGLVAGRIHAVTFTSAPAVRNFFAIADEAELGAPLRRRLNDGAVAACVGPVCAGAARAEGLEAPLVPEHARLGPLVRSVTDALAAQTLPAELGGRPLVLRGTTVVVDGAPITLSDREAAVLRVLLAGKGVVHSKAALLESVWSGALEDPHAVEVIVARLRRRLGPAGAAIKSVPRRGYLAG
ncbi:MAG: uroporphyrinogen-III synthase [Acidimicrobiales bacterium]